MVKEKWWSNFSLALVEGKWEMIKIMISTSDMDSSDLKWPR